MLGFVALLLGASACVADGPGGVSAATSSSSGESSGSSTTGLIDPSATSLATGADTATAGTTVAADGTSTGVPSSTSSGSSSGGSSSGGTPACGDGVVQAGEQCDKGDFQGMTCGTLGFDGGLLFCDLMSCTFDTSNCSDVDACGNDVIDPGEQCDGDDLQGFDCASLGLEDGDLDCDPVTCTFDTSDCGGVGNCGNGSIDPGEQCDGADLQGFDCASLGLMGGVLSCDPVMCTFDTSMCMPGGGTSG